MRSPEERRNDIAVFTQEEWTRQATHARSLVTRLRTEEDPKTLAGIYAGLRLLIDKLYNNTAQNTKSLDEISWEDVRQTMASVFMNYLPEESPENLHAVTKEGSPPMLLRRRAHGALSPRHIAIIVDHFGLHDGIPKTTRVLADEYGIKQSSVSSILINKLPIITRQSQIRKLVLPKNPHSSLSSSL